MHQETSMTAYRSVLEQYEFEALARRLARTEGADAFAEADVLRALERPAGERDTDDFLALLSAAARPFLPEMESEARRLTRAVWKGTVALFAPLYLSNTCKTVCTYCGFSNGKPIKRKTLTVPEIEAEGRILHARGMRRLVLLTGEDYTATPVTYLADACRALAGSFPTLKLEVYPLQEADYVQLAQAGATGVICYQETYERSRYGMVHMRGMKRKYDHRLDCLDRAARAGIRELSPGALLGLSDPAADTFFAGMHARYLKETYKDVEVTISLPRLRPAAGFDDVPLVPDPLYMQMLFAVRLFLPNGRLVLSTREPPELRAHLSSVCIDFMSAEASVAPGGYSGGDSGEQFSLGDHSSVEQVVGMLSQQGLQAIF